MNSFFEDLERGKAVERKALAIIQRRHPCAVLINAFQGYDIWVPEIHKSVEVKYDPKSNETGNIVIEVEMNGKPSALSASTADYWLFYDDHVFVMMKKQNIHNCIDDNKLRTVEFTGKGDKVSKKAFLIKKDMLFSYGTELACE